MPAILDLLREIKLRPAMYLGSKSLVCLKAFLDGWHFARVQDGTVQEEDPTFLSGFQDWVQKRYRITSSHCWAKIIGFFEEDDVAAFHKAMALFEEYSNCWPDESAS